MSRRAAIVSVSLFIIAAVALVGFYISVRPARYELLDSRFGSSAWQPAKLVEVLSWRYQENHQNPYSLGSPEFFDFQHQALLRLLDIQQEHFGRSAPPREEGGTYIDHCYVRVTGRTGEGIVVIGTATHNGADRIEWQLVQQAGDPAENRRLTT